MSAPKIIRRAPFALALLLIAFAALACEPKGDSNAEGEAAAGATSESTEAAAEGADEAPSDEAPATADGAEPGTTPGTGPETSGEAAVEAAEPAAAAEDADRLAPGETAHFGADFTLDDAPMALDDALSNVDELAGKPVKVTGTVKMACRKKGCWMQMMPTAEGAEPLRVTFLDYGFFVPKYADNATAVMEGTFETTTVSEGHRKHLARDANKPEAEIEAIEGDLTTVSFVATAVDLTGGDATN